MKITLRSLGPNEAKVVLTLRERGREIVSANEIIHIIGSEGTARKVIHNLLRKGWLSRLMPGRYMFLPPEHGPERTGENNALALASAAVEPSYVSWWAAASFHGFTTQRPMAISVAVLKQLPTRLIEGTEVKFVKVAARKFFGAADYKVYGRTARLSTPAKTIVDCIDRPELAGGPSELTRIVYGASQEVGAREVVEAAIAMQSVSLLQRLGYLIDLVGWPIPDDLRSKLHAAIPQWSRSRFGREKRRKGDVGYVAQWRLFVNARRSDLLADVPQQARQQDA